MSECRIGIPIPEETRRKISDTLTGQPGRKHTEESKKKLSIALTGKPKSEEHKKNMDGHIVTGKQIGRAHV